MSEPLPDRVRMPLLDLITQQSLDEDYQHVADRAVSTGGSPEAAARRRRMSLVAIALFGLLIATAFAQTSRNAPAAENNRATLIERVRGAREDVAAQQSRIGELRDRIATLQGEFDRVAAEERAVQTRLLRLQVNTGYVEVQGPGVRATVDDAPGGDQAGVVRDEDLAMLVDALWSAGAEAIAINGRRLTMLAAIRTSSAAIHIGGRPISPPYTIAAIGDPNTLESFLADSTHGQLWFSLVNAVHFVWDIGPVEELTLPAARQPVLRLAKPLEEPLEAPSGSPGTRAKEEKIQ